MNVSVSLILDKSLRSRRARSHGMIYNCDLFLLTVGCIENGKAVVVA